PTSNSRLELDWSLPSGGRDKIKSYATVNIRRKFPFLVLQWKGSTLEIQHRSLEIRGAIKSGLFESQAQGTVRSRVPFPKNIEAKSIGSGNRQSGGVNRLAILAKQSERNGW